MPVACNVTGTLNAENANCQSLANPLESAERCINDVSLAKRFQPGHHGHMTARNKIVLLATGFLIAIGTFLILAGLLAGAAEFYARGQLSATIATVAVLLGVLTSVAHLVAPPIVASTAVMKFIRAARGPAAPGQPAASRLVTSRRGEGRVEGLKEVLGLVMVALAIDRAEVRLAYPGADAILDGKEHPREDFLDAFVAVAARHHPGLGGSLRPNLKTVWQKAGEGVATGTTPDKEIYVPKLAGWFTALREAARLREIARTTAEHELLVDVVAGKVPALASALAAVDKKEDADHKPAREAFAPVDDKQLRAYLIALNDLRRLLGAPKWKPIYPYRARRTLIPLGEGLMIGGLIAAGVTFLATLPSNATCLPPANTAPSVAVTLAPAPGSPLPNENNFYIQYLAFSDDGSILAADGQNPGGTRLAHVYLWSTHADDRRLTTLTDGRHEFGCACGLAFGSNHVIADGNDINAAGSGGVVQLRQDAVKEPGIESFPDPDGSSVETIAFSPDGHEVAEANAEGRVHVLPLSGRLPASRWSNVSYTDPAVINSYNDGDGQSYYAISQLMMSGANQIIALDTSKEVFVWNPTGAVAYSSSNVVAAAVNAQGTTLAMANATAGVRLYSLSAKTTVTLPPADGNAATGLAFSPDGAILAVAYKGGTIRFWDIARRTVVKRLPCGGGCENVEFSPTGNLLAAFAGPPAAGGQDAAGDQVQLYDITESATHPAASGTKATTACRPAKS
ncbi:MAG TPA: hypothetical protein VH478_24975 [Trebonia sp.]|nr:hypothetical protein [Trebonia sp.]